MKILTILGSPRKKGNTAKVLEFFEDLMRPEHEVDRVTLVSHDVRGCLGCSQCQEDMDTPGCVQKDDAPRLLERLLDADVLIYATPLYASSYTSQMKAFIDRHFCLLKFISGDENSPEEIKSLLQGNRIALLVTCAGPVENNADLIQELFARFNALAQTELIGCYVLPFCTTPDQISARAQETAVLMSRDVAGSSS